MLTMAALSAIIALNALGGGIYGLAGAKDIPQEWLSGSPFNDYLLPSLFLFVVVGGSCALTAVFLFLNKRHAVKLALGTAILLMLWIIAQISVIGYVSWMQPAVFGAGFLMFLLTFFLNASTGRIHK